MLSLLSSGGRKAQTPTSGPRAYHKGQPTGLKFTAILGFSEKSCKIVVLILIGKYLHTHAHTDFERNGISKYFLL